VRIAQPRPSFNHCTSAQQAAVPFAINMRHAVDTGKEVDDTMAQDLNEHAKKHTS
jgi:hypothetical protein